MTHTGIPQVQPGAPPGRGLSLAEATAARNAWIEVDLDALATNARLLRTAVGPGVELIAVIKANAYGAGAAAVAPALEVAGVERFAVVWVSEAVALRRAGVTRPVIVLGHAFPEDAAAAVANDITLTVDSLELGQALSAAAVAQGATARVHLHVDSGLHREGIPPSAAIALARQLRDLPGIDVEGLSTHMANADEPDDSFTGEQGAVFRDVARELDWVRYRHTANSATALRRSEMRFDGVRVGLALLGVLPPNTPGPALQPVVSVKACIARVTDVAPGEGVSYGLTWRAGRPSRVALVPVGYADGWPRHLGNTGLVLAGGRRCPMVGRVCMDQFLIDITDSPEVIEGTEAVLLGAQGSERIAADEIAAAAGTIAWDILASLQARLPRIAHRGGVVERIIEG